MTQQTIERLHDLRLRTMADAYLEQKNKGDYGGLNFDDRLQLLVEAEWLHRFDQRVKRRLKNAKLKQPACLEDIDYKAHRGLDRKQMEDLATCHWIRGGRNIILTGPTGVGKSWLACALCNRACREGFNAMYHRVPRLAQELKLARGDGSYLKVLDKLARCHLLVLDKLARCHLLVLDDWALSPMEGQTQHDLLEVIDDRAGARSTIVTSQVPIAKWHDLVGDPSVADALLDRLVGTAIKIELKGASLRRA